MEICLSSESDLRNICGAVQFGKCVDVLDAGADAYQENAECVFTAFGRIVDMFLARKSDDLYVGGCTVPEEMPEPVREKAVKFARSLLESYGEIRKLHFQLLNAS